MDALSTNTITLLIEGATQGSPIVLTDASPVIELIEITAMNIAVTAGDTISAIWNSDSVGLVGMRMIGFTYRIVNPRA